MIKLELTTSQIWLITRALREMTREKGMRNFRNEFPKMNENLMLLDVNDICAKIEEAHNIKVNTSQNQENNKPGL